MDRLWVCVKKLFMCDDDKKEFVLRDCNKRWREFKTRLTREYLTQHEKNEEEHPPWKFYPGIDEDDWKLFKELREKPEFKAISEQNRSNQAKNEHPHHLGRGGYEKQEERKIKAQLKNVALSSTPSSSGAEFEMPAIPPKLRYEKWIEGRKEKNGNIPNEKTKEIVEKIYELRQKEKSGDFVSSGSHDILTEALGTPENGGYVRGVGGKTTLTSIFKRKKRGREINGVLTFKQVEEFTHLLTEQVREKTRAEMKVVTLELLKSCGIHVPNDVEVNMNGPTSLHPRSSCHSIDPDPFVNGSKEPIPCELLVLGKDQVYRVVARGTLCKAEPGEIIHNVPLLEDHVKVTILDIVDGEENTPLPLPFFGHEYLGDDVKGSWAQWPRKQVRLSQEINQNPQKKNKKNIQDGNKIADIGSTAESHQKENENETVQRFLVSKVTFLSLPKSCKDLYNLYKNQDIDFSVDVEFEENIFYYPERVTFTAYVFEMAWLNISCVHIWIRCLQNEINKNEVQGTIGVFLSPKIRNG